MRRVSILGDSRVFDTYYVDSEYTAYYGYDRTFAHLLTRSLIGRGTGEWDVVHIPDHFRAGTIENNIIRLALTNPDVVVLCDGIWETLLNRGHFEEFVRELEARGERPPPYSSELLASLFVSGQLSISPKKYLERQARILSYFHRRRRRCVWMSLPVPDRDYLSQAHHAGGYKSIPGWQQCLRAINEVVAPLVSAYGGTILDLDELMQTNGGPHQCLIDQWHFSVAFHEIITRRLERLLLELPVDSTVSTTDISLEFMLPQRIGDHAVAVFGSESDGQKWLDESPGNKAEIVGDAESLRQHPARIVVLAFPPENRREKEVELLEILPPDRIVLYPEETRAIYNPPGTRDAEQGR